MLTVLRAIIPYHAFYFFGGGQTFQAHRAAGEERRRRLAISLATLSKKPDKRGDVVEHGGVAALAKLSRSEETRTRSSCAQVSQNKNTDKMPVGARNVLSRRDTREQETHHLINSVDS